MAFDLAISDNGDLLLNGVRDLKGVTGQELIEQRIKTRLRINRGSWIYDDDGTLGSNLYTLMSKNDANVDASIIAFVHQALAEMDDITIENVQVLEMDGHAIGVQVMYLINDTDDPEAAGGSAQDLVLTYTLDSTIGSVD